VADIADAYVRVTLVPRAQFGQRAGTFSDGGDPRRARVSDKKSEMIFFNYPLCSYLSQHPEVYIRVPTF
jgi:hypothetical protein